MVRKDERGEGKFDAQTKALELATYTVNITDNPKVFTPDHEDTTKKIVAYATDIYHRTRVANNIPFKTPEAGAERKPAPEHSYCRMRESSIRDTNCKDGLPSADEAGKILG